jgi:predicted transcriptional regulator
MADPAGRLAERRRLDSQTKAARVIAALDAMAASGTALSIAALARNARVSRRFIYDHPELRAEAERRTAQIIERHSGAIVATARVTAASLRADLANATAANHRLSTELAALRRRLGQLLGQEVLNDLSDSETAASAADAAAAPRVGQLEATLFATQEELARRTEELEAARQINRELLSRLNRHGH